MLPKVAPTKQFLAELEKIKTTFSDIASWADAHITADDVIPRRMPQDLSNLLNAAFSTCEALASSIRSFDQDETDFLYQLLVKLEKNAVLSEYEFYLCRGLGVLKNTVLRENEFEAYLASRSQRTDNHD
jgi:hypothetical protein